MKTITLYNKFNLILDDEDFDRVFFRTWHIDFDFTRSNDIHAIHTKINGKSITIGRFILKYDGPFEVDHKDRNPLNNQKGNLRIATKSQQAQNRQGLNPNKFKGVHYRADTNKFRVIITKHGKSTTVGQFDNAIDAAKAYDCAALKLFGEFAYLNFPEAQNA